jgi:hypothetical protein
MNKKIIVGVVVLIALAGLIWFFTKAGGPAKQQVSTLDAIDTVTEFYNPWLIASKEGETAQQNKMKLVKSPILGEALRAKLTSALQGSTQTIDPVLCQSVVPEGISTRSILTDENEAQLLITSKDKKVTEQAFVTLSKLSGGWYINDIECSLGEFAPDREFSFENVGYLLKGSIPKPYDSKFWHLVYEVNGQQGNVAPLLFDKDSQCTSLDGNKSVCKPDQFTEATKVSVHAQMSERGAHVKKLEFVE